MGLEWTIDHLAASSLMLPRHSYKLKHICPILFHLLFLAMFVPGFTRDSDCLVLSAAFKLQVHAMVSVLRVVFLGASILFVNAQITSAPTATPTVGNGPLPLTQYTFTYPNVVSHCGDLTHAFLLKP